MADYKRVAHTHEPKPSARPLDKKSARVVTGLVRLPRAPERQNRSGPKNPWK